MTDSGCLSSLQCKSKFGKVDLEMDNECDLTGSRSEQSMNICTHLTNTPSALQDKERNGSAEISSQSCQKNNNGSVSPVLTKQLLPVAQKNLSSFHCYSTPKILDNSNTSQSYFTDPTVSIEEQASAEVSFTEGKFFSTPMPLKGVRKKLTPVMEVDYEPNMSEEWQPQDKVSRREMLHKNCADVLSNESPIQTPLYRSSFAAECQDIVNHIKSTKTAVKSPVKWKVDEADVSSIYAEPPPYDCTPMKSLLACEVAKMISSLESSPVREGPSLCGESLLDLEKTDMLLNVSDCSIKNNKKHSLNDAEGLSTLSSRLDSVCVKRQKAENLEKTEVGLVNKLSALPNMLDRSTPETPAGESLHIIATSKCRNEEITAHISNNVLHAEELFSNNVTEPAVMIQHAALTQNVGQVVRASRQALVGATAILAPVQEVTITACIRPLNETEEYEQCASTTQDLVLSEGVPTDATRELNEVSIDTRPCSTSINEERTTANVTQVTEILPHTFDTTQNIPCTPAKIAIANTTQVIEVLRPSSGNNTQDIILVHDDAGSANTTQDVVALPANTTQEITPMQEVVTVSNTTQVIEAGPQLLVNATQDIPSMNESKIANATHEMEVPPQSCPNTTQEIVSVQRAILMASTTQSENFPQVSANKTHGNTTHEISPSCTQDVGVMLKSSVEVVSGNEANPNCCNDAVPEKLRSPHDDSEPTNGDHLVKDVVQPSLDMDMDEPPPSSVVIRNINLPGTAGLNVEISTSNMEYDLTVENKKDLVISNHKNVSKLDPKQETFVVNDEKLTLAEPTQASVVALTPVTDDPKALISSSAPAKQTVTEDCKPGEGHSCITVAMLDKESRSQQLVSESCNVIQEEENTHDVSVFSVGSLSFVTSTPVPGLSNFPFLKTCRESVQIDSNLSIGSVLDDSANKVPGEKKMMTCNDKGKEESSLWPFLPPTVPRSMVPSDAVPKPMPSTSGIPSVRRSLILSQNTVQNTARDLTVSKIPARGIPGRSMIRPPMPHQNLSRPSLVNPKPLMEGPGGSGITNKLTGNRVRPPKAVAVVKAKAAITQSLLPIVPPSVKLPSRLGAPGTTGRLPIGCQNAAANLHIAPSGETTPVVRQPISTGIRTGILRPGTSSTRPPLQQSQKVSPKLKPQVKGLLIKKNTKELSVLRRETGSKAENASVVKSTVKQVTPPPASSKEVAAFQAGIHRSSSPNHTVQTKAENHQKFQSSLSSNEDLASVLASSVESAESGHGGCQHLEICKCCQVRYQQLLQKIEELERHFGQVQQTPVEISHMAGT